MFCVWRWDGKVLLGGHLPIFTDLFNFRNILGQLAGGMPQAVTVTAEERQAIERVSLTSCLYVNH